MSIQLTCRSTALILRPRTAGGRWVRRPLAPGDWSRATIARLDTITQDLRKYGFTLITGLLTASALLGAGTGHPEAATAAFIAVMSLIAALFAIDLYYSVMQSGAVERALDLEAQADPPLASQPIRLTKTTSHRLLEVGSSRVVLGFHTFLIVVTVGLGTATAASSTKFAGILVGLTVGIGAVLFTAMVRYSSYTTGRTGMHRERPDRSWPE
ncbi:MAG TPA: hypothetical protein VKF59_13140 [Candidatus Dormibacteraeota bacterium]|nr:hypothetical protein [Candidatus Dormibacteraeota bacterium]